MTNIIIKIWSYYFLDLHCHETTKTGAVKYVRRHIYYISGGSTDHREICEKLLGNNEIEAVLHRLVD